VKISELMNTFIVSVFCQNSPRVDCLMILSCICVRHCRHAPAIGEASVNSDEQTMRYAPANCTCFGIFMPLL